MGIALAITPWNFPLSMVARKVAPALAAGCPVVLKPSEDAPFLVFGDADPDRLLVEDSLHDDFVDRLAARVSALVVGPGLESGSQIGPMTNRRGHHKAMGLIEDALRDGARPVTGGGAHPLGGTFLKPAVLTGVNPQMRIFREEVFAPVVAVVRFRDEAEAVALANDTEAGLAAYVYTGDGDRIWRMARALQAGMIGLNDGVISTPVAPFGGVKQSGLGREGTETGLREYLEERYLCIGTG